MKLLLFAASLRKDSYNKKLIRIVNQMLKQQGEQTDLAEFSEFNLPLYNADIQEQQGIPDAVKQFVRRLNAADGLIISSPEYNFSMPGTLKNFIDWVSREQPMPWTKRRILLMSASPSLVGGNRGLWNTRVPLECCGAFVYPDMFSLAAAHNAFSVEGELQDQNLQKRLQANVNDFLTYLKSCKKE